MHVITGLKLGANILMGWLIILFIQLLLLCQVMAQPTKMVSPSLGLQTATGSLSLPVSPQRNVEDFQPVTAKFIRFKVFKTNGGEPCIDELEIFTESDPTQNVALASRGARASASGTLPGYQIHQVAGVNDGQYGNGHSWVADQVSGAWVQIELPTEMRIERIVWSRDREGFFVDRLATDYVIEVSTNGSSWHLVASSADHAPIGTGDVAVRRNPMVDSINPFGPVGALITPDTADNSPEYRIDRWQTEDGLPDNTVSAILQTRDGYLWIGTMGGLVRFDGVKFKRYNATEGLKNERVLCLYEDQQGHLWVGTDGGGLFRFENDQFVALTIQDGLSSDVVMDIAEDKKSQLWIGTYAGLDRWQKDRFVHVSSVPFGMASPTFPAPIASASMMAPWRQPPTNAAPVSRIAFDSSDNLWNVVGGRLFKLEEGHYVMPPLEGDPSGQDAISTLHLGLSGRLWLGGISGYVAALSNEVVTVLPEPSNLSSDMIMDICEARNGDVWVGTASSGLRRWHDGKVLSLTTEEGLSDNSVRCVMQDREGNMWVGTSHGGLNRLKPKKLQLVTTRDGLSDNVVLSLAEDVHGKVWVGSNGGGLSAENGKTFAPVDLSYLLDKACITSLLFTRNGDLWIGTWNSGLILKTGKSVEQFNIDSEWEHEPVLALCEDHAGKLWVGTYQDGLKCFQNGKFTSYQITNGLSANYITSLAVDGKDRLWIGTGGFGLDCYTDGAFRVFTRKDGLASNFVRALYVDAEGVLWIGTSSGLSWLKNGKLTTVNKQQGLWDDVISQILEDNSGHLWFGSNRGIFRVSKDELNAVAERHLLTVNCLVFGREEGMENLECTGGFCPAGLRTSDGRLWFSTVNGLAVVDPKNILVNNVAPPVVLEEVLVDGREIENGVITNSNGMIRAKGPGSSQFNPEFHPQAPLKIGPGARRVEFHYTALGFTSPEKIQFRYRLKGLDSGWVEADRGRIAEYPYLPPGRYTFNVAACGEDGIWSESSTDLELICLPAFWQTVYFRLLMIVIMMGGAGWVVKFLVTSRLQRRIAILQQQHTLEKERTRIARDIHDELGALLTEISLLSDHGQKRRSHPGEVEIDLRKISEAAREAVQTADGIVWAVNPRNDSLDHLANYLVHFAEDFFRLTSIRCRLDVPVDLSPTPISTQHRHHLLLAVKETCNNIARHSGASEVWLRINITNHEFSITIEDNGKGFHVASAREGSDGLLNIRERMEEIGGFTELTSKPGEGTRLRLILPLT
jgi:ligand-binding sensor domain-containing protein/signal transduction histidine kinase